MQEIERFKFRKEYKGYTIVYLHSLFRINNIGQWKHTYQECVELIDYLANQENYIFSFSEMLRIFEWLVNPQWEVPNELNNDDLYFLQRMFGHFNYPVSHDVYKINQRTKKREEHLHLTCKECRDRIKYISPEQYKEMEDSIVLTDEGVFVSGDTVEQTFDLALEALLRKELKVNNVIDLDKLLENLLGNRDRKLFISLLLYWEATNPFFQQEFIIKSKKGIIDKTLLKQYVKNY